MLLLKAEWSSTWVITGAFRLSGCNSKLKVFIPGMEKIWMVMLQLTSLPSKNASCCTTVFGICCASPWQFPLNEQRILFLPKKILFQSKMRFMSLPQDTLWVSPVKKKNSGFLSLHFYAYQGIFKKKKLSVKIGVIIQVIFEDWFFSLIFLF